MGVPDQDQDLHDVAACARAWQTLRLAHDRVARRLGAALSDECALAINEFDVLLFLRSRAREGVRMGALLEVAPLSQPALSRLVTRLEDRGLISRSQVESDRRAIEVHLTEIGAALVDRAIAIHTRVVHEMLSSRLTEREQTALLRTLSQIGR
jgi:DNA-binding MarR family transcriptional regulator